MTVKLEIQELQIQQDFHVFYMGGANAVLGIEWLKWQWNWGKLTMKIKDKGGEKCLKGDSFLSKTIVSLKTMLKTL